MKAMLFKEAGEDRLGQLVADPAYVAEQKMDGTRVLLQYLDGEMVATQRTGAPLKFAAAVQHMPDLFEATMPALSRQGPLVLDGELIIETGEYRMFDVIALDHRGEVLAETYRKRRDRLFWLHEAIDSERVAAVPAIGGEAKALFVDKLIAAGAEGVMFKRLDGLYVPGERSSDTWKVKFVKTAEVVVMDFVRGRNEAGREVGSAKLGAYTDDGVLMAVGATSLIGKPEVQVGDVIEIQYLYWTGTSVYQPRMTRVRNDKTARACRIAQFPLYSREVVL